MEHGCRSIAFPLISTGNYGFPKDKALQIAISAFSEFLLENDMQIYLVVFNQEAFRLSEKLFHSVASFIDEHYVEEQDQINYGVGYSRACVPAPRSRREMDWELESSHTMPMEAPSVGAFPLVGGIPMGMSLEELLRQEDAGFSETVLKLIDERGKKDSEIYKKANLSKAHFSKIRNNPGYRPTKQTAVALALALELNLDQTKDLIGRAGYALSNSSKFDLIIRYFIERKKYNVVEINMTLYEFDQRLLGS